MPVPIEHTASVIMSSFPTGVTAVKLYSDSSSVTFTQPGTQFLTYVTGDITLLQVFCPEGTSFGSVVLSGQTIKQSDMFFDINSEDNYYYSGPFTVTITDGFTIDFIEPQPEPSVTDLTGTTWVFNSEVELIDVIYEINFTSNNFNYTSISCSRSNTLLYDDKEVTEDSDSFITYHWYDEAYRTITITGGTDATNATLIAWLQANAVQQLPEPTATLDLSTLGLAVGTHRITVKAVASGYADSPDSNIVEYVVAPSGYEVELYGNTGSGEHVYVQINDDPTWYYAQLGIGHGFEDYLSNIPNVYQKQDYFSIGIQNVSKIKIGTQGNPSDLTGPFYAPSPYGSTGDFANLTFTATGGSAPAYATGEITMTQDSKIYFEGND